MLFDIDKFFTIEHAEIDLKVTWVKLGVLFIEYPKWQKNDSSSQ